eukprot:64280-Prorocentrum_minimum.AAC.2
MRTAEDVEYLPPRLARRHVASLAAPPLAVRVPRTVAPKKTERVQTFSTSARMRSRAHMLLQ